MSLLPTERLGIALCPGQVGVVRLAGWPRARVVDRQAISVAGTTWREAIEALDRWLETAGIGKLTADVVLSNRYARFAWLPWNGDLDTGEQQALVEARFRELYGDMRGWTFGIDPGRYGQPSLASAVERALVDELKSCFERRRIACRSLQPYFVAGWNRWRRQIESGPAMFAVAESGSIVLGALEGQGKQWYWRGLRAMLGQTDAETLPALLARESLLQGFAETPPCHVLAPGLGRHALSSPLRRLADDDDLSAPVAMALCGAQR